MRFSKAAILAAFAAPIIGSPIKHDAEQGVAVAAAVMNAVLNPAHMNITISEQDIKKAMNTQSVHVARHEDGHKQEEESEEMKKQQFMNDFFKAIEKLFESEDNDANATTTVNVTSSGSITRRSAGNSFDIMRNSLIQSMNATIQNILFPKNITVAMSRSSNSKRGDGRPTQYMSNGNHVTSDQDRYIVMHRPQKGQRLPYRMECPGWPAKQRYNATHWREWHFTTGYEYGELRDDCLELAWMKGGTEFPQPDGL